MDYFLDVQNAYMRLMNEFATHGKLIIAYDFDDTVFDYHNRGGSYTNVIELLRRLKPYANFIVLLLVPKKKRRRLLLILRKMIFRMTV